MRFSLLVLGIVLVCAVSAQDAQRGRERLRELVQRARAGDSEAQNILASRRRKIGRNNNAAGEGRAQAAVQAALAGPRNTNFRRPSFQSVATSEAEKAPTPARSRQPLNRARERPSSRREEGRQAEVRPTTFRPTTTTTTTEAATLPTFELTPIPVEDIQTEVTIIEEEVPAIEPQPVQNNIPSLFRPAQFGQSGIGVQAEPQPIERTRPSISIAREQQTVQTVERTREPSREPERQRISFRNEPHRALNRGLETGSRSELFTPVAHDPTEETSPRPPPVQTIRRYSYFDEAGNYIFGYEAEDGSFKEEIRGRDCIVNGKYGYVDPSGIRREFTYVSGNKCDPNNPDANPELNDQFLQQTQSEQLSDAEVAKLSINRRRKPTTQLRTETERQRSATRVSSRPEAPTRLRPAPARTEVELAPKPIEQEVIRQQQEVKPVDLTPTNEVPNIFKPAQFNQNNRVATPQRERFPIPDFIAQSDRPRESSSVSKRPVPQQQAPVEKQTEAPPRPTQRVTTERIVTLPPPPPRQPTHPPRPSVATFNFDQEFSNVFSHFGNTGAPRPQIAPPQPPSSIPSLFRPAQFNSPKPAPAPPTPRPTPPATPRPIPTPPVRAPIDDNAFVLTAQQQSGTPQLVFDAATGTFKTVLLQNNQINATPAPAFKTNTGRPLPLFEPPRPSGNTHRSPLPPIPTSAAEFDRFFAQFANTG